MFKRQDVLQLRVCNIITVVSRFHYLRSSFQKSAKCNHYMNPLDKIISAKHFNPAVY